MATTHKNRVQMTVTGTPGTGTITLSAAASGYQSLASAYGADAVGDFLFVDGTAWEVARDCAYTHSGTTLSRGTLEASSTGSAISLTSAAVVSQIATAEVGNRLERAMQAVIPGGRLTLESGAPVSTTDQTAKTTIYYTPYVHDTIPLWDGARWVPTTFTETSLALGTLTSGKPYDVFGYLSSGALVMELLVWTADTTRATAVTIQDGRYCKSGDKTRLLLGSIYTTSTTTTEDSQSNRYVGNVYNALPRQCVASSATTHTYTTASVREYNGGTGVTRGRFISPFGGEGLVVVGSANLSSSAANIGHAGTAVNTTGSLGATHGYYANCVGVSSWTDLRVPTTTKGVVVAGSNYVTLTQYGIVGVTWMSAQAVCAPLL